MQSRNNGPNPCVSYLASGKGIQTRVATKIARLVYQSTLLLICIIKAIINSLLDLEAGFAIIFR